MKRKGCLPIVVTGVAVLVALTLWRNYSNRPAALYERWIGDAVPDDVLHLDGHYRFALTESVAWLSFKTAEARIARIVERNELHEVVPDRPWNEKGDSRWYSIDGKRHGGNWFDIGGLWRFDPVPPDLKIYWRNHDGRNATDSGWALYFSPGSGVAYWTSISI